MADTQSALGRLETASKQLGKVVRRFKKASGQMEANNYVKATKALDKAKQLLEEIDVNLISSDGVLLIDELEQSLEAVRRAYKDKYTDRFRQLCIEKNLRPVEGDHTKGFRVAGLFRVQPQFDKDRTKVTTLARRSTFEGTEPARVVRELSKMVRSVFRDNFDAEAFLKQLFKAYERVVPTLGEDAILLDVMKAYWEDLQTSTFWETYDNSRIREYSVDELSVDLSRLVVSGCQRTEDGWSIQLKTGGGGVVVYFPDGHFNSYKYVQFRKGE